MSSIPLRELAGAAVCIVVGTLVAGAEAAVVSLPEVRLRALHDEVGRRAKAQIARYLADPTRVLSRLLAIRVTCLIVASVLATNAVCAGREVPWKLALTVLVLVFAYGLLAELFMTIGRARGRALAPLALAFTQPLEWIVTPVAAPLSWVGRAIFERAGHRSSAEPAPVTEREVEYIVEEAEHSGAIDPKSGQMMQNVLELKDLTARDVMVPRTRMHAIEAGTSLEHALAIVTEEGHSRVPVYRGQIDNIVGVLHVKDLFRVVGARPSQPSSAERERRPSDRAGASIESLARKPPLFVSDSQSALAVLRDMQAKRTHMAFVVDEFGAVAGLVTLEDVLEELVGDIQDEHDADEAPIVEQGEGRYLASAAISISDLSDHLGVEFPEAESYASLGGFLAERAGKVPAVGTVVRWGGFRFIVREGDARRATKVEIVREAPVPQASESATAE